MKKYKVYLTFKNGDQIDEIWESKYQTKDELLDRMCSRNTKWIELNGVAYNVDSIFSIYISEVKE